VQHHLNAVETILGAFLALGRWIMPSGIGEVLWETVSGGKTVVGLPELSWWAFRSGERPVQQKGESRKVYVKRLLAAWKSFASRNQLHYSNGAPKRLTGFHVNRADGMGGVPEYLEKRRAFYKEHFLPKGTRQKQPRVKGRFGHTVRDVFK